MLAMKQDHISSGERIEQLDRQIAVLLGRVAVGNAAQKDYDAINTLVAERDSLVSEYQGSFQKRA
jgi:hypothetical protein